MPPKARSRLNLKASKSKMKAEAAAKAAEEARIREEERKREEERLAIIAAEKAKFDAELKERLSTPQGQLNDLLRFLDSVPLTRKCVKKLERELSDGVAIAEIISHFCPDICDGSRYFEYSSAENKRSNWDHLNRKVFPELGFQLTPSTITNLIRPYDCGKFQSGCSRQPLIYEVLRKVREGIGCENPEVYEYRKIPESEQVPCKAPVKPKFVRRPRVTEDKPPYSKIEIQIAQGKFDQEDQQLECARAAALSSCYTIPCQCGDMEGNDCNSMTDWVKFQGPGGGILFEEQCSGDYATQPMDPPQQCWKL